MFDQYPREIFAIALLASIVGQVALFKYFAFAVTL